MNKRIIFIILLLLSQTLSAQDKTLFDRAPRTPGKAQAAFTSTELRDLSFQNDKISMTLIEQGKFTLGTVNGLSMQGADDQCQITFGHPYALTSYPFFKIDNSWYRIEDFFSPPANTTLLKSGDTLYFSAVKQGVLELRFSMFYNLSSNTFVLKTILKNLDTQSHAFTPGLAFDPALGKNGDGFITSGTSYLTNSTKFTGAEIPQVLNLWEKDLGAKGLGISLSSTPVLDKMIAANWNTWHDVISPDGGSFLPEQVYDLLLHLYWAPQTVAAGGSISATQSVVLNQPDLSRDGFLRWDMPLTLTVDNNLVYPQSLRTYAEIYSTGQNSLSGCSIQQNLPEELISDTLSYFFSGAVAQFRRLDLVPQIIYDTKTVAVKLQLLKNAVIIDELQRFLFIPASPVSDTGLTVTIDSLISSNPNAIRLRFYAERNDLGYKLTNLAKGNILLYENQTKINTYSLQKDTSGGSEAADIVFVLDVTGSMGDEINAVKQNIIEFADSLTRSGIDFQLGMVTFLDATENIYPFTKDIQLFQQQVAVQYAHGGGDTPENSLQALLDASRFSFRNNAKRILIWITDANYQENNSVTSLTRQVVLDSLLVKSCVVQCIGSTAYKTAWYDPIVLPTNGKFYDINGNFRDILLDISRLRYLYKYWIQYSSPVNPESKSITLKVRYAGLGGEAITGYGRAEVIGIESNVSFYPNPFNPEIVFKFRPGKFSSAVITVYDILGNVVRELRSENSSPTSMSWDAKNTSGEIVSSGVFIVQAVLTDYQNRRVVETAKIIHVK
ncbi:MAG: VWA domain-containing protein [Ignavibacteriales bacterium]|nr:VWA domain-containing protein [Ignavibacteriales bacterium]